MLPFLPWYLFLRILEPLLYCFTPVHQELQRSQDPRCRQPSPTGSEEPNSDGLLNHSNIQGKNETNSGKWDNHNTIARGWAGPAANYHPVTFRSIYNVDAQKPGSVM